MIEIVDIIAECLSTQRAFRSLLHLGLCSREYYSALFLPRRDDCADKLVSTNCPSYGANFVSRVEVLPDNTPHGLHIGAGVYHARLYHTYVHSDEKSLEIRLRAYGRPSPARIYVLAIPQHEVVDVQYAAYAYEFDVTGQGHADPTKYTIVHDVDATEIYIDNVKIACAHVRPYTYAFKYKTRNQGEFLGLQTRMSMWTKMSLSQDEYYGDVLPHVIRAFMPTMPPPIMNFLIRELQTTSRLFEREFPYADIKQLLRDMVAMCG